MKRALTGIAAAAVVLGTLAPAAFASTASYTVGGRKAISVNGVVKSQPYTLVKKEGNVPTSYMGVWYLGEAVKAAGGSYTWDVSTKTFAITAPGVDGKTVADGIQGGVGTGDTTITVNGVTVKKVNSFAAKDPAGGSQATTFLPIFYLGEVFSNLGGSTWDGKTFGFKTLATYTISGVPTTNIATGTKAALSLTAGSTTVTSGVTWSVDGNGGAVIDPNTGNFVASAAGTYTVTASYNGTKTTGKIVVFGQAVGYKVTNSASNLLADNTSIDTVTVTAVDSNGNAVLNYNGTAAVIDSASPSLVAVAANQPSDFSAGTLTLTNGVGTFAVGPTAAVNVSDTITVTDKNTSSPLTSTTYTFSSATSTLSKLALAVATGNPTAVSANGQYSTTLTLSAENAAGNVFSGQPGTYVNLTLTGPGSFQSGTTPVTSETVYVPSTGTLPVTVYSQPGQAGSIVVSAAATGLTSASLTVPSYINTAAGSLSVTSTNGTDSLGNGYTLYTVQLLDTNGHPITTTAANDAFTVSDNSSTGSGVLQYGTYDAGTNVFTPDLTTGFSGNLVNGIATFAVESHTVGTGTPTLTVTDTPNSFTKTATYSYAAGVATKLVTSPTTATYNVKPGQTVTFSAQLEDTNSNNVAKAGVPVTFTFLNNVGLQFPTGQTTYVVNTNANGVASITFTIPSSSTGGTLQLSAAGTGLTTGNSAVVNVLSATNTSDYATQVAIKDGSGNALSSVSATAKGASPTVTAKAENAIGAGVTKGDVFSVTSSNSNVVSVTNATVTADGTGVATIGSDLVVGMAGTSVITVQDISNPDQPKATFTVNVAPGTNAGAVVEYNGAPISATNTVSVPAGTAVALQVVNADSAGDPIPVVGSAPLTVNLGTSGVAGEYRLSATGAPVTSVTLNPGQSSTTVYFISSTAETLNSGTQLTASEAVGALASITGFTYATSTVSVGTPGSTSTPVLTGQDANGNAVTPSGGTFSINTPTGANADGKVTINAATGVVTVASGAAAADETTYTVTYTQGGLTKTATVTVTA